MTRAELDILEPLALSEKHTVVLVDDDPAVLASLKRLLRKEPYEVRTTSDARAALDWIQKDEVSLVVMDQRMPEMCGTELAERVRRISPETVRVMLTAYPGNAAVRHGLAEDVQWLVSKPWNDDALKLALRRLLREQESSPPLPSPSPVPAPEAEPRGLASGRLRKVIRKFSGPLAKSTGWILGFLWMADAGGKTW
jgi:CheY-like chemotaxis protein